MMPPIIQLEKQIANCTACGLHKHRTNIVFGRGVIKPPLMFIGEAPGADEDLIGKPFVGRAGKFLISACNSLGIEINDCYITNVLLCRPPDNKFDSPSWGYSCQPRLMNHIAAVRPKFLVLLGKSAAVFAGGQNESKTMSELRGLMITVNVRGVDYMATMTYHPAYILRNQEAEKWFMRDLRVAWDMARG